MSVTLQRAASILFYLLGVLVLVGVVLTSRGLWVEQLSPVLHSADLPLLCIGMIFGGTTFYNSLTHNNEKPSKMLAVVIAVILFALLGFFAWLNFALTFNA